MIDSCACVLACVQADRRGWVLRGRQIRRPVGLVGEPPEAEEWANWMRSCEVNGVSRPDPGEETPITSRSEHIKE